MGRRTRLTDGLLVAVALALVACAGLPTGADDPRPGERSDNFTAKLPLVPGDTGGPSAALSTTSGGAPSASDGNGAGGNAPPEGGSPAGGPAGIAPPGLTSRDGAAPGGPTPGADAAAGIQKLTIKDVGADVKTTLLVASPDQAYADAQVKELEGSGTIGLVFSQKYVFTADPVLDIEAVGADAATAGQGPRFTFDHATVKYTVPGYDIPALTITLLVPMEGPHASLPIEGVAKVSELVSAFAVAPARVGAIAGTVTISIACNDLDPQATAKTFTIARAIPLTYRYVPGASVASSTPAPVLVAP